MSKAIILDTETTGTAKPKALQIAYFDIQTQTMHDQYFNPGEPSTLGALAIHHILDEMVADKQPVETFVMPECSYIIGHNIDYDWNVLGKPNVKRICTLALAKCWWPNLDSHTLGAIAYYLLDKKEARSLLKDAHNAAADVLITAHVLIKMLHVAYGYTGNISQFQGWDSLWQLSESARIPKVMSFGKHKGTPVEQVPQDYKDWYRRQAEPCPYLLKAFGF